MKNIWEFDMYAEWEVYDTYNEETMVAYVTEAECWRWIKNQSDHADRYDVRWNSGIEEEYDDEDEY